MPIEGIINIRKNAMYIVGAIFGIFLLPVVLFTILPLLINITALLTYLVGIITIIVLIEFLRIMPKRTKFGNEMLGKIDGFIKFLEVTEISEFESFTNEKQEEFYDILSYAYALGKFKQWIEPFFGSSIKEPEWYSDLTSKKKDFCTSLYKTMKSIETAMIVMPDDQYNR